MPKQCHPDSIHAYTIFGSWVITLLLCMPATATTAGDSPPLTTDRPSQSDASTLVPPGYFQSEIGYTYTRDDAAGGTTKSHSIPNLSLRYGLLEKFEIRFGWNGYFWSNPNPGSAQEGSGDGQVSAKLYLWQESGWLPETTLLAGTTLSFGKDAFSSNRSDPFFRFLMSHSLPGGFSVGSNLGVTWTTRTAGIAGKDTAADFIYTALLGYSVSPDVDAFVEFFGTVPLEEQNDSHSFDAGMAWRVLPAVQIDLFGGIGLNDAAVDAFISTGLSFRLP